MPGSGNEQSSPTAADLATFRPATLPRRPARHGDIGRTKSRHFVRRIPMSAQSIQKNY
ncbi:hypothetical protein CLJ1_5877 [Pseudomonas paraeruginosa]|nr:hypothetical protein CLJ1_5877 [Pseudomonas aeruginosa]